MIDLPGSVVLLDEARYQSAFLSLEFRLDPLVKIVLCVTLAIVV